MPAEIQAMFRHVNENIRASNGAFAGATGSFTVVCECADIGCIEALELDKTSYLSVRRRPDQFLVAPGHEDPERVRVVQRRGRYSVVVPLLEKGHLRVVPEDGGADGGP
jgi:hypothetical protein